MTPGDHGRGGLDHVSFELGRNASGLEALNKVFEQHCEDDDRRHVENVKLLEANTKAIGDLTAVVKTLADSVSFMRPVVDSVVVTKGRIAMLASAGFFIVVAIGWALEAGFKWLVSWVLKAKFGGP